MGWQAAVVAVALALAGCATAPIRAEFHRSQLFAAEEAVVWPAVVRYFSERSMPIKNIERASGLLASEVVELPRAYLDCGASIVETPIGNTATINVLVQAAPGGQRVAVTLVGREQRRDLNDQIVSRPCESTGFFETDVLRYVAGAVGAGK